MCSCVCVCVCTRVRCRRLVHENPHPYPYTASTDNDDGRLVTRLANPSLSLHPLLRHFSFTTQTLPRGTWNARGKSRSARDGRLHHLVRATLLSHWSNQSPSRQREKMGRLDGLINGYLTGGRGLPCHGKSPTAPETLALDQSRTLFCHGMGRNCV